MTGASSTVVVRPTPRAGRGRRSHPWQRAAARPQRTDPGPAGARRRSTWSEPRLKRGHELVELAWLKPLVGPLGGGSSASACDLEVAGGVSNLSPRIGNPSGAVRPGSRSSYERLVAHGALLRQVEEAATALDDPVERLRAGCHAFLRYADNLPDLVPAEPAEPSRDRRRSSCRHLPARRRHHRRVRGGRALSQRRSRARRPPAVARPDRASPRCSRRTPASPGPTRRCSSSTSSSSWSRPVPECGRRTSVR